jgi:hypothetical protein
MYTWVKDSHGLFDYDYTNVTATEFKLSSGSCGKEHLFYLIVYLKKNEEQISSMEFVTPQSKNFSTTNPESKLSILYDKGEYFVY